MKLKVAASEDLLRPSDFDICSERFEANQQKYDRHSVRLFYLIICLIVTFHMLDVLEIILFYYLLQI